MSSSHVFTVPMNPGVYQFLCARLVEVGQLPTPAPTPGQTFSLNYAGVEGSCIYKDDGNLWVSVDKKPFFLAYSFIESKIRAAIIQWSDGSDKSGPPSGPVAAA